MFIFTPISLKYDGMEFRWYCKQKTETFPMNPNNLEERLFENGSFLPSRKILQSEIDKNKDEIGPDFQDGGCFGRGPGNDH